MNTDLLEKLVGDDETERIYAAEDIAETLDPLYLDALVAQLERDPSRAVREAIFAAVQKIDSPLVIAHGMRWLGSEDAFVRNQAVTLLQAKGSQILPTVEQYFFQPETDVDIKKFILDILVRIDAEPECVDHIYHRALLDPDINIVCTALENIGVQNKTAFITQTEAMILVAAHPMVVTACLETLTRIGDAQSWLIIKKRFPVLSVTSGLYSRPWLEALGKFGEPADIDLFADCFAEAHNDLWRAALDAYAVYSQRHPAVTLPARVQQGLRLARESAVPASAAAEYGAYML